MAREYHVVHPVGVEDGRDTVVEDVVVEVSANQDLVSSSDVSSKCFIEVFQACSSRVPVVFMVVQVFQMLGPNGQLFGVSCGIGSGCGRVRNGPIHADYSGADAALSSIPNPTPSSKSRGVSTASSMM